MIPIFQGEPRSHVICIDTAGLKWDGSIATMRYDKYSGVRVTRDFNNDNNIDHDDGCIGVRSPRSAFLLLNKM